MIKQDWCSCQDETRTSSALSVWNFSNTKCTTCDTLYAVKFVKASR
jgi:hypothetical protein